MFFFFQAEDGIRDLVRSRGLGDVYKRQVLERLGGTLKILIARHKNNTQSPQAAILTEVFEQMITTSPRNLYIGNQQIGTGGGDKGGGFLDLSLIHI